MPEEFWKRIKNLIKNSLTTQRKLALTLGFPERAIEHWIHENKFPDVAQVYKIAQYFDVSMEWLLTGTERNAPEIPNDVLELARDIAAMPPVVKESLTAQIDVFKRNSHAESQTDTEIPSDTASSA